MIWKFENPLMHTKLDRALLAPHSPLYRQPLVYIPCKNESTLFTDVSMGSSFLDNASCFHFLRIASYFDCVVGRHDSVLISATSSGIFLFQIVSLIIEQLAASSLVIVDALLVCIYRNCEKLWWILKVHTGHPHIFLYYFEDIQNWFHFKMLVHSKII